MRENFREIAEEAAARAGRFLMENLEQIGEVAYKGEAYFNPASRVDRDAESIILEIIGTAFPEHNIITEERGEKGNRSEYTWMVDPLDGTVNYIHGYRHFSVSLALTLHGEVVLGVVYNPVSDEMYMAEKGKGTYLNQRNIRVSAINDMRKGLFSLSFPYGRDSQDFQDSLKCFQVMARDGQALRREGSTALSLCAVAAGRFDGFCVIGNEVWDYAAGLLLVREAGGMVTDFQGQPFRIGVSRNQILATNGRVHDAVLKSFRDEGIS